MKNLLRTLWRKLRWLPALVLGMGLCLGTSGCGLIPQEEELPAAPLLTQEDSVSYTLTQVFRSDLQIIETIRATYIPSDQEKLSFPVGGEVIKAVYVSVGDTVEPGELLMELSTDDLEDDIRQQQNNLDSLGLQIEQLSEQWDLELEEARAEDAWDAANGVSVSESRESQVNSQYSSQYSLLNSEYEVSRLRLDDLYQQLSDRQIYSTIQGTVTYVYSFELGEVSIKDRNVVTVSNMDSSLFEVFSGDTSLLEPGGSYTLTCSGQEYACTCYTADQLDASNVEEGGYYFSLDTPASDISQGATGTVTVVAEESPNALCLPSEAISEVNGQTVVYVLNEDGYRQMQEVTTGLTNGKITEILSGLSEGDSVVLD